MVEGAAWGGPGPWVLCIGAAAAPPLGDSTGMRDITLALQDKVPGG